MARSPNYPQIGLRKAIELARVIYKVAHTAKAPASTIASALGYNSLNGSSLGVLSALKKFGLMESVGEEMKIRLIRQRSAASPMSGCNRSDHHPRSRPSQKTRNSETAQNPRIARSCSR